MTMLSNLSPLLKKRKRVGRGGSRGGTAGKGHKGQKARSGGKIRIMFEGGQMPLTRRLPKRGFSNVPFRQIYEIVNIGTLEAFFDTGTVINKELLIENNIIKGKKKSLVKILGHGELKKKFIVHADAVSKTAQEAIKNKGGEVHITQEK